MKKRATINKPRLEKKANYLMNFEANCLKNGQICHIWPREGQPGNPALERAILIHLMPGCQKETLDTAAAGKKLIDKNS